jgi:hypothetical protein
MEGEILGSGGLAVDLKFYSISEPLSESKPLPGLGPIGVVTLASLLGLLLKRAANLSAGTR